MWDVVGSRVEALLAESAQWTGGKQRLTATRLHEFLIAEGNRVGVTLVKEALTAELITAEFRARYPDWIGTPAPAARSAYNEAN